MLITIDDAVVFTGSLLIEQKDSAYYCTCSGEFRRRIPGWGSLFARYESFNPPLDYSMTNVRVITGDAGSLLRQAYEGLKAEQAGQKVSGRRIGFL